MSAGCPTTYAASPVQRVLRPRWTHRAGRPRATAAASGKKRPTAGSQSGRQFGGKPTIVRQCRTCRWSDRVYAANQLADQSIAAHPVMPTSTQGWAFGPYSVMIGADPAGSANVVALRERRSRMERLATACLIALALVVWLRNVIGIRRVGRWRRTPGASTGSSERARREEWPDARDPPERPHHPGRARRDRPLGRAHRRAGPALRRQHRDCSQVAQTRADGVPGPLQPPAQAALEGERGGARRGLRAASRHRLPAG